jgi:DNA-binding transcriptional MerR regulator
MSNEAERFSLGDLAVLTGLPQRTVRFYIQQGLLDRPEGVKRGAYYTRHHLEQLLTIRKWQRAGLSLERIHEIVASANAEPELPPAKARQAGDVRVQSHVLLRPGVELVIDPSEAGLTAEEVRELARDVAALFDRWSTKKGESGQ